MMIASGLAWPPTRDEALRRLNAFLSRAGRAYAATRNEDRGPDDRTNVSVLSPYLRRRIVTEAEVVRAIREEHGASASRKFVQEVLWRTYWKGALEGRPVVWDCYVRHADELAERLAHVPDLAERYDRAVAGTTGIAAYDTWTRELIATGYLHNHARMWFASIWIFTLELPWELGAAFFLRHLLDGDPASNTLSWRWVAGLHTRGKTYLATRANVLRFTGGRLDPGPQLARRAYALEDDGARGTFELPPATATTPGPALLVVHEDDLGVESLPLGDPPVRAVVGLAMARGRSASVEAFADGALDDALRRAQARFRVPTVRVSGTDDAAADTIASLAQAHGTATALAPFGPLGPVREALAALAPALAVRGVHLTQQIRDWDRALWPFARAGYFTFWSQAEPLLEGLAASPRVELAPVPGEALPTE